MAQPFIGEIRLFAGNFAPIGHAFCEGQLVSIAQNTALFSLLGTTYGGDGQTTFALPDLRSRVPVGWGQGPGLPFVQIGERLGAEAHALTAAEMPLHNHAPQASTGTASAAFGPTAAPGVAATPIYDGSAATASIGLSQATGSGQAHSNMAPSLAISFVIALDGIFPSRN